MEQKRFLDILPTLSQVLIVRRQHQAPEIDALPLHQIPVRQIWDAISGSMGGLSPLPYSRKAILVETVSAQPGLQSEEAVAVGDVHELFIARAPGTLVGL